MKVKIQIEFEVETGEDDDEAVAKSAASMAAWDHLCLTNTGQSVVDEVEVHVDGHGSYTVKLGEDHE